MSDGLVKQALEELQDLVRCQCHDAYKDRGLHDPTCCCDSAEAVKVVSDRIEELEAKLAKAVEERDEALNQLDSARHSVDVLEKRVAELTGGKDE